MNGVLNIYKEKGYTSFDVVAKLRGILRIKKIGHTGTLDPDAEGVLPICVGNATGLCELLTDKVKVYDAVLKLGLVTDTQDISGNVLREEKVLVTSDMLSNAINEFIGGYDQIPPMYSAIKVNGKKLYELAREGKEIERAARHIIIHSIDILDESVENGFINEAALRVTCSKGTYIRTLCHDIGERLSCGGCMKSLIRIKSGKFEQKDSLKLSEVEELSRAGRIHEVLIPTEAIISYKKLTVKKEYDKYLNNGNILNINYVTGNESDIVEAKDCELFKVYNSDGGFAAIYKYDLSNTHYRPYKMFL